MDNDSFDSFFHAPPPGTDVEGIRKEWLALQPPYGMTSRRLPLPVWARRGLPDSAEQAWATLCGEVGRIDPGKAFCLYLHIPFCASRCGFCDCYSFRLAQHRERHIRRYRELLRMEMRAWSRLGSLARRPVSTVHFGGGTPTLLGTDALRRLAEDCREHFAMDEETEWALETTTSELTDEMSAALAALNFRRIHFGVQSLEPLVRAAINRRESPDVVLQKIAGAVSAGAIVSVDLILGLPGQTLPSLIGDIDQLAAAGVDGFSLYELQSSRRNRAFIQSYHLADAPSDSKYFLFQAASRRLEALGYRKTLFNHFAREKDANLYFTFPQRGEDCLALGTIADGYFGDYHYRHPEYAKYCQTASEQSPGLQGGIRRSAAENAAHPVITAILSGTFPSQAILDGAVLPSDQGAILVERWLENALVKQTPAGENQLTGNGSWFAGNMIEEIILRSANPPRGKSQALKSARP